MNDEFRNIIVIILVCIAAVAVGHGIYASMEQAHIEPCGMMTGGCDDEPMGQPGTEAIPWDEVIYVPAYPECAGEKRVHVDGPIKIEYENGTTMWHQIYTCQKAEMNRTNVRVDATRLPDYELPE